MKTHYIVRDSRCTTVCGLYLGLIYVKTTTDIDHDNLCENCKRTNEYKQAKNKQREAEQMELKKELSEIVHGEKTCDTCKHKTDDNECKLRDYLYIDDDGTCADWEAMTAEQQPEPTHGKHYKEGMQTIDKFNTIAGNLEGHVTTEQIVMLFNMVKYIDRMGKKDDVEKEAYKTADYFYRALNGRFLNEEN